MNTRTFLRHNSEQKFIINNVNYLDIDKYRDELIKLKQELNKRNKEYQDLKVEYLKLEKENKSNIKMMELIICESNSNSKSNQNLNMSDLNDNNKNNMDDNKNNISNNMLLKDDKNIRTRNLCKQTIQKIKNKYIYTKLKEEINHLKEEISEKDTLMSHLKNSSKIIRLRELDNKYADTYHELVELKDKYKRVENIQQDYYITKNKLSNLFQQVDFYKKQSKSQKEQLEKIMLQNQSYIKIIENNENQKNIEENKKKFYKIENEKLKKQIKDLSLQNYNLTDEAQKLRGKTDKNMAKLKKENKKLKEENEKYKKEIENLKKKIFDKEKEKNKDDFFMTSAKIVADNYENKSEEKTENKIENNNEEKKEDKNKEKKDDINYNENDLSILNKENEDKKLETKDIEILDLKSENVKKEEKK